MALALFTNSAKLQIDLFHFASSRAPDGSVNASPFCGKMSYTSPQRVQTKCSAGADRRQNGLWTKGPPASEDPSPPKKPACGTPCPATHWANFCARLQTPLPRSDARTTPPPCGKFPAAVSLRAGLFRGTGFESAPAFVQFFFLGVRMVIHMLLINNS
jgi:hypothetical protein